MKKKFDSVKMMREIRDKISKELSNLTVQEKIALLKKEFLKTKAVSKRNYTSKRSFRR